MGSVSILIPICNVEKFLPACLDSVTGQTLRDVEIICINDGSKDASLSIINDYASRDGRIVVIDKKNSGYGDSMNRGLKIATGEYVGIVESDDYADAGMFERLYSLAKAYDADLVRTNFYRYWGEKGKSCIQNNLRIKQPLITDTEKARSLLIWAVPSIWAGLYRRSWLNDFGLNFLSTPGASYQDTGFAFKTCVAARKIVLANEAYLHYRVDNNGSSVKNNSLKKALSLHQEWDSVRNYLDERGITAFEREYLTLMFASYHWNYQRIPEEDRDGYFALFREKFAGRYGGLVRRHLPSYCRHGGGLWALEHGHRKLFDALRWIIR